MKVEIIRVPSDNDLYPVIFENVQACYAELDSGSVMILENHEDLIGKITNKTIKVILSKGEVNLFSRESIFDVYSRETAETLIVLLSNYELIEINQTNVMNYKRILVSLKEELKQKRPYDDIYELNRIRKEIDVVNAFLEAANKLRLN